MKTTILNLVGGLMILGLVGCNQGEQEPLSLEALAEFRACVVVDECIYVQNGCCDCANGGEAIAVNIEKLGDFNAKFDCAGYSCTQIAAIPACTVGTLSCVEQLCTFTRP